jgi:cytochrome b561
MYRHLVLIALAILAVLMGVVSMRSSGRVVARVLVAIAACGAAMSAMLDLVGNHETPFTVVCAIVFGTLIPALILLRHDVDK